MKVNARSSIVTCVGIGCRLVLTAAPRVKPNVKPETYTTSTTPLAIVYSFCKLLLIILWHLLILTPCGGEDGRVS